MAGTIRRMHAERCGCGVKKRIVRPDGEIRYIRCVGIPVIEDQLLKGFLGSAMDITKQELLTREFSFIRTHGSTVHGEIREEDPAGHAAGILVRSNLISWYAAIYCTQVHPDTIMVCCAAPWFSFTWAAVWALPA